MSSPQILHLRSSAGLYGAEHVILGLLPALRRQGVDCTLLCLDNPGSGEQPLVLHARRLGLPVETLSCRGRLDWSTVRALRARAAAAPDLLLHVHDYKSAFYAWLARGRAHWPIVATSHGHFNDTPMLRVYRMVELALMRRFEHVCIVSRAMEQELLRWRVPAQRMSLIENGIDTQRFRPQVDAWNRAALGLQPETYVFGAVMRLVKVKFPIGLLEAYATARHPDHPSALLIAGDGPMRDEMLARAQALGIAHEVKLLGARDDLEGFYRLLNVFVLSSLSEGLPLSVLEAMACDCPVIATAVGQLPVVLADLPARLVSPGSIEELALAMRAALTQGHSAEGFRERVEQQYSVDRMGRDYAAVYRSVLKPCRRR